MLTTLLSGTVPFVVLTSRDWVVGSIVTLLTVLATSGLTACGLPPTLALTEMV